MNIAFRFAWCAVLLFGLPGCAFHASHFFMPSDRPVDPEAAELGRRVESKRCRWFLFRVIPLNRPLSPADQLEELAGDDVLLRVSIEERLTSYILFVWKRCMTVAGRRVDPRSVKTAPEPEHDEVAGWPSMPLGGVLPAELPINVERLEGTDGEVWLRPHDVDRGFHGMDVAEVRVVFEDGRAVRTAMQVPPNARRLLTLAWGAPEPLADDRYRWRSDEVAAVLDGRELVIELR